MEQRAERRAVEAEPVTDLLVAWGDGDTAALDRLIPRVYRALRRIAAGHLRRERPGHTLDTTALVHEAYLRLVDQRRAHWRNRAQFFGVAARMMRRILVDHARRRKASVQSGLRVTLAPAGDDDENDRAVDVLALDQALTGLADQDPRAARIVELRFFVGLTITETAAVLEVSPATVVREWSFARTWLRRELAQTDEDGS